MREAMREVTSLKSFVTCPGGATETPCSKWTNHAELFATKPMFVRHRITSSVSGRLVIRLVADSCAREGASLPSLSALEAGSSLREPGTLTPPAAAPMSEPLVHYMFPRITRGAPHQET